MDRKTKVVIIAVGVIVFTIILFFVASKISYLTGSTIFDTTDQNADLEKIAICLSEKGAQMYGASWCGHCTNQKAMFGDAAKSLPYIECDANSPNAQVDKCQQAGITGYPTWIINGQAYPGEQSIDELKKLSGC
ncbi:MAG: hypothetical protein Q7S33_00345 [Nanoarchaeota archaeon]|nr:hypothetical protein [Nanoarchaeota archaeon]